MDTQDYNQVVFNQTKKDKNKEQSNQKKSVSDAHHQLCKLEDASESQAVQTVSLNVSQQIQKARIAMKMTQKQLAEKAMVNVKVISDYESGKAIPNEQIKRKIEKALGCQIRTKKV